MEKVDAEKLSAKSLKAFLETKGVNTSSCFDKESLMELAVASLNTPNDGQERRESVDPFLRSMMGASSALTADFELMVMGMTVKELKKHLTDRNIDFSKVSEKEELQLLAVQNEVKPDLITSVSEHLLEC